MQTSVFSRSRDAVFLIASSHNLKELKLCMARVNSVCFILTYIKFTEEEFCYLE